MRFRKAICLVSSLVAVVSSRGAWAHDWLQFDSEGSKPERQLFLMDLDWPERDTSATTIKFAILSEKVSEWPAEVIADVVVDCGPRTGTVTRAELRRVDGSLIEVVTQDPFGGTLAETERGKAILGIACENRWPAGTLHLKRLTLEEVHRRAFGADANVDR